MSLLMERLFRMVDWRGAPATIMVLVLLRFTGIKNFLDEERLALATTILVTLHLFW